MESESEVLGSRCKELESGGKKLAAALINSEENARHLKTELQNSKEISESKIRELEGMIVEMFTRLESCQASQVNRAESQSQELDSAARNGSIQPVAAAVAASPQLTGEKRKKKKRRKKKKEKEPPNL